MSILLIIIGVMLLSLSMDKHYKNVFGSIPRENIKTTLKVIGWGLLILSASIKPLDINLIYWYCQLSITILLQAFILTLCKRKLERKYFKRLIPRKM